MPPPFYRKRFDQLIGSPAMKWLLQYNSRSLGEIQFHQVGLWKEEKEERLLLFLWDSLFSWFFFPDNADIGDYQFADRKMSPRRQKRKLASYRVCHPAVPLLPS